MTVYQNGKAGQKEIMIRYPSKNKRQVWAQSQKQDCTRTHKWSVKHQTWQSCCQGIIYHTTINITIHTETSIFISTSIWPGGSYRHFLTLIHILQGESRWEKTSWKHFRFCLLSAHFHWIIPKLSEGTVQTKTIWGNSSELICATHDLISKAKYSRITGRGFVHALSQILVVLSVLSSLCPSFTASKASLKNSSENPGQVPEFPRSILYSFEQEWWEISFLSQWLLLS